MASLYQQWKNKRKLDTWRQKNTLHKYDNDVIVKLETAPTLSTPVETRLSGVVTMYLNASKRITRLEYKMKEES
eukprot:gene22161-28268_t